MKKTITVCLIIATTLLAQARIMRSWSYQEIYDGADVVVIANPISIHETTEKAILPNISPDVHVVGLSTEFEISLIMKGDKDLKRLVLHHYRLANPKELMMSGPALVAFDPEEHARFLLFLHHDTDGRYSPVSGQTDPRVFSILKLQGVAE